VRLSVCALHTFSPRTQQNWQALSKRPWPARLHSHAAYAEKTINRKHEARVREIGTALAASDDLVTPALAGCVRRTGTDARRRAAHDCCRVRQKRNVRALCTRLDLARARKPGGACCSGRAWSMHTTLRGHEQPLALHRAPRAWALRRRLARPARTSDARYRASALHRARPGMVHLVASRWQWCLDDRTKERCAHQPPVNHVWAEPATSFTSGHLAYALV
jgi:hypothetical protein